MIFNYKNYHFLKFKELQKWNIIYKFLFYFISTLIIAIAFSMSIFTAIFVTKIKEKPDWYPYLAAFFASFSTFFASILTFLKIKEKIELINKQIILFMIEINKYNLKLIDEYSSIDREYNLFLKIEKILKNNAPYEEI